MRSGVRIRKLLTRASGTLLASRLRRNRIWDSGPKDGSISAGLKMLGNFWAMLKNVGSVLGNVGGMPGGGPPCICHRHANIRRRLQ